LPGSPQRLEACLQAGRAVEMVGRIENVDAGARQAQQPFESDVERRCAVAGRLAEAAGRRQRLALGHGGREGGACGDGKRGDRAQRDHRRTLARR
jgi:hypothetical protein